MHDATAVITFPGFGVYKVRHVERFSFIIRGARRTVVCAHAISGSRAEPSDKGLALCAAASSANVCKNPVHWVSKICADAAVIVVVAVDNPIARTDASVPVSKRVVRRQGV